VSNAGTYGHLPPHPGRRAADNLRARAIGDHPRGRCPEYAYSPSTGAVGVRYEGHGLAFALVSGRQPEPPDWVSVGVAYAKAPERAARVEVRAGEPVEGMAESYRLPIKERAAIPRSHGPQVNALAVLARIVSKSSRPVAGGTTENDR
jgi:hypothetical protein